MILRFSSELQSNNVEPRFCYAALIAKHVHPQEYTHLYLAADVNLPTSKAVSFFCKTISLKNEQVDATFLRNDHLSQPYMNVP